MHHCVIAPLLAASHKRFYQPLPENIEGDWRTLSLTQYGYSCAPGVYCTHTTGTLTCTCYFEIVMFMKKQSKVYRLRWLMKSHVPDVLRNMASSLKGREHACRSWSPSRICFYTVKTVTWPARAEIHVRL